MTSPRKRRPWRWILLLLVLCGLGFGAWRLAFPPATPVQWLTEPVTRGDIERSVLATGTLEADLLVSVGAQASGQIDELAVELGQRVEKGALIARIDSSRQDNDLRNAEAALANVRAQLAARQAVLKQSQLAFERQRGMLRQNATSREEFEAAEATLATTQAEIAQLEAQISQAEIEVDTARVNVAYTRIEAPIDGTVVAIVAQEGQTVNANQTTPTIVKLAQLEVMEVKAQISEADVIAVKPGQPVWFTVLGDPARRYTATLDSIEPAPDSISSESSGSSTSSSSSTSSAVYYNGRFRVPNEDGSLRISMTAQVHVILAEAKDALAVPSAALGPADAEGWRSVRVLRGEGAEPQRVRVRVGLDNNVSAEVLEGLAEGDRVVVGEASSTAAPAAGGQRFNPRRMRL